MPGQHTQRSVHDEPSGAEPLLSNWSQLNGNEKYNHLSTAWGSTEGKTFASADIEEAYRRRTRRWLDMVSLRKTDQVPVYFLNGEYALHYAGCKPADRFYHPEKAAEAIYQFHRDFQPSYMAMGMPASGKALDRLGYQPVLWPGSHLTPHPEDMQFQYVEKEFMAAAEYDELIANPEGYIFYKYLPRICDGLKGLAVGLNPVKAGEVGGVIPMLIPLAKGPLRQAIDILLQAADEAFEDMQPFLSTAQHVQFQFGTPITQGGSTKAPFDILGDTMRGTRAVMLDMYRRPDKVVAACEALIPAAVKTAIGAAISSRNPFVVLYLHKGADGFMSNAQFEKFYWPSLKAVLLGMIHAGLVPLLWVQGSYDQRLDIIASSDLPAGKSIWLFDRTELAAVKKKLGRVVCFGGNVPSSLFSIGTPAKMTDYCEKLIDTYGKEGGFFLSPGAAIDQAKPENVRAFLDSARRSTRSF